MWFIAAPWLAAHAQDLIVDGTTLTVGGVQTYRSIEILHGGTLYVADGTELSATDHVLVDDTSRIDGLGRGYEGSYTGPADGPGPGTGGTTSGGGGGAHFGAGGPGASAGCVPGNGRGGVAYDNVRAPGNPSGGSGAGGEDRYSLMTIGGAGGASLVLSAPTLVMRGTIDVSGEAGRSFGEIGTGGGGGGAVTLVADVLRCTGELYADGGAGGAGGPGVHGPDQGGGGGGGLVVQRWDTSGVTCAMAAGGGAAPLCASSVGGAGYTDRGPYDYDGDGTSAPTALCVGRFELDDGLDQNCNGVIDDEVDVDGDGIDEADERALATDPYDPDSDDDGLNDGDEVAAATDPLDPDTDHGGLLDGDEVEGKNPLDGGDDALFLLGPTPGIAGRNRWLVEGAPPNAQVTLFVSRYLDMISAQHDCSVHPDVIKATGLTNANGRVVLSAPLSGSGERYAQVLVDAPACLYTDITTTVLP